MITLRRERIKKFEEMASKWVCNSPAITDVTDDDLLLTEEIRKLAVSLADASQSRTEAKGIEWAMVANRPVSESDLPIGDDALEAFERDMQCPPSWTWYPAKTSDEPAWKYLREFVVKTYQADPKSFEKYYTWARQPMSRGAKLPIHIRQDPMCFEYAWQAYQAANGLDKTDNEADYRPRISA